MQPLQQIYIAGSKSGLRTDIKPFMIPEDAFSTLENAYVWRDRVVKRDGIELVGRLRRLFVAESLGLSGASPWTFNIYSTLVPPIVPEANATIEPGSVIIVIGGITFTDQGDGTLTSATPGNSGTINYVTGNVTLTHTAGAGIATTISFGYFPGLPVMGIWQREIAGLNDEQTIFFDTVYAYINAGAGFQEWFPGTIWAGTNSDFFWATNYRGSNASIRLFFMTNFVNNALNPMRYSDGTTITDFYPLVADSPNPTTYLTQARILIPYYGRLLALNVWESPDDGIGNPDFANGINFFNRCRFSQIGDPTQVDAWRSDLFGKGGFIDAPTNEEIVSATFFKNTLIVGFERSTWQLRYVGEYGLPFIWERISSDFGCESTFSATLFDQGVLQVGDRAITASSAINVERIDLQIPDQVFDFVNVNFGRQRIHGIRDFQKELVYWNYVELDLQPTAGYIYPNKVLVYNYRNNTYAKFRDNVTCFGVFQLPQNITWDRLDIFWDDTTTLWDDNEEVEDFPATVIGNQQGYIHYYGYPSVDDPSLAITAITFSNTIGIPTTITVPNHNIANNEWIHVSGSLFTTSDPGINDQMYIVTAANSNTLNLYTWNGQNAVALNLTSATYVGGGQVTLHPKLDCQTKDFNPFQLQGAQIKISYVDFLMDAFPQGIITVNLILNSSQNIFGNIIVGNKEVESALNLFGYITNITQDTEAVIASANHGLRTGNSITFDGVLGMIEINGLTGIVTYIDSSTFSVNIDSSGFTTYSSKGTWRSNTQNLYIPGSQYAWHRFFATSTGQFIRIQITYDNDLMSNMITHETNWILDAISLWVRPGSRTVLP